MIDRQRLAAWIQPRHLDDQALEAYRSAFTSHPARLVIIRDFLAPDVADRLGRFLANEAEFKPEFGLYSIEGAVKLYSHFLRQTFKSSWIAGIGYLLARPAMNALRARVDAVRLPDVQNCSSRAVFESL